MRTDPQSPRTSSRITGKILWINENGEVVFSIPSRRSREIRLALAVGVHQRRGMPKTTMTPDDMKAYLKAWDEVNAAHNALMTHLLEAGSDKECEEANRRLDAAIAKAQEFRHKFFQQYSPC